MDFQFTALDPAPYAAFFEMSEAELSARQARLSTVTKAAGTPCRVSLQDANVGERVLLVNHCHQPGDSPYRASHAVYLRAGVRRAEPGVTEVPPIVQNRLLSVRFFDAGHMIVLAEVVEGAALHDLLCDSFEDQQIAYAQVHIAKPGCFAAEVKPVR